MSTIAAVIGRILLAILFIVSGIGKLFDLPATNAALSGISMGGLALVFAHSQMWYGWDAMRRERQALGPPR